MSNPFEAPQAGGGPAAPAPGDFDIRTAFDDGMGALSRNWLPWLGVMIVAGFATGLSILFCIIPVLVVGPAMFYGQTRFALDAVDGDAEFNTLFSGFDKLGDILLPLLGLFVLMMLVSVPGQIASSVLQYAPMAVTDDSIVLVLGSLAGMMVSFAWSLVIVTRFLLGPYLVVERGTGPVDAMTQSWALTAPVWGKIVGFMLAVYVVMFIGFLFCFVGIIPAALLATGAQASVYRQLTGSRVAVAS